MLKKRIIPCLDVKDGRVVKGVNFVNLTDVGDPVDSARAYYEAGCDELVFLDITATSDNRETTVDIHLRHGTILQYAHHRWPHINHRNLPLFLPDRPHVKSWHDHEFPVKACLADVN